MITTDQHFPVKAVTKTLKEAGVPRALAPALACCVGSAVMQGMRGADVAWTQAREIRPDVSMPEPARVGYVSVGVGSWWAEAHVHEEAGELRAYVRWDVSGDAQRAQRVMLAWALA